MFKILERIQMIDTGRRFLLLLEPKIMAKRKKQDEKAGKEIKEKLKNPDNRCRTSSSIRHNVTIVLSFLRR